MRTIHSEPLKSLFLEERSMQIRSKTMTLLSNFLYLLRRLMTAFPTDQNSYHDVVCLNEFSRFPLFRLAACFVCLPGYKKSSPCLAASDHNYLRSECMLYFTIYPCTTEN
jgi:hypothetical protein